MDATNDTLAPDDNASDDGALRRTFAYHLGEVARLWRGQIDRQVRPLGLSFMQWLTLLQLSRADTDFVQKDLALAVGIEGPTMVGVLDRLVKAGLVERRVARHDRRANTVHLTDGGLRVLDDAERELRKLREVLLEGLSEAELETSSAVLARVGARAKEMSRGGGR